MLSLSCMFFPALEVFRVPQVIHILDRLVHRGCRGCTCHHKCSLLLLWLFWWALCLIPWVFPVTTLSRLSVLILLATHKISFCLYSLNASYRMVIHLLPDCRCHGERKQVPESVRMRKLRRLCLDRWLEAGVCWAGKDLSWVKESALQR